MPNHTGPMACPVDGANLVMSERQGVEIDYCPQCRGVWLDRGELDKIIERGAGANQLTGTGAVPFQERSPGNSQREGYHKRKKSFLEELFD